MDRELDDRGEHRLKGVAEPQRLFRVRPPPRTAAWGAPAARGI